MEIIQSENYREQRLKVKKTTKKTPQDLWDDIQRSDIYVIRVSEDEKRGQKKIFEEMMAKYLESAKDISLHNQEAQKP